MSDCSYSIPLRRTCHVGKFGGVVPCSRLSYVFVDAYFEDEYVRDTVSNGTCDVSEFIVGEKILIVDETIVGKLSDFDVIIRKKDNADA